MIKLHFRYTYTAPAGTISEAGMVEIQRLLQRQYLRTDAWLALNPDTDLTYLPALPEDWQWTWLVAGRGEYVGTFAKRLRKFYFKAHGLRVPDALVTEIGNIARAHSSEQATYEFEFVDEFNWQAGDFGDRGSCYWGRNSQAREMLTENDALAIRFYKADGSGFGRAWVVALDDNLYIVFNGYGLSGPDATLATARVMAGAFNLSYRRIALANNGTITGLLYINNGRGYVIGAIEAIDGYDQHDFGWDDPYSLSCASCGDHLHEDDAYYGADDEAYCSECFYNQFGYCANCDSTEWQEDLTYVEGEGYCASCLDRHFTACDECGEYCSTDEIVTTKDDRHLCPNCAPADEADE